MKNLTKILFLAVSFVSFKAEAALPLAFSAGRAAFTAGRFALTHGVPAARTAFQATKPLLEAAKPHLAKAVMVAKANPQGTLVLGGAAFGAYNAKEGLVHTTIGAGLGAAAFLFPWSRALNAKHALALAGNRNMIGVLELKVVETQTKLHATQQGYAVALAKLKDAAKPMVEKVGFGLGGKKFPVSPSVAEQAKNLWNLWRLPKPSVHPESALPALFGAA